jgi:ABC-type nitrate/sulfonate/bicarbonate transport system substrate-binding protein
VAVRQGTGRIILDVRRGLAPAAAMGYTFAALVTRSDLFASQPEMAAAVVRGLVRAHAQLRADPGVATSIGEKVFPPMEATIIAELVRRDVPYYDATVSEESFASLQRFAAAMGLLGVAAPYDRVVASNLRDLWT